MEIARIKLSGNRSIGIENDADPINPREYNDDTMPVMNCIHSHYNLGDKHSFKTPQELIKHIKNGNFHHLPLYLYDHSGITMSTKPFPCPWDSGQVGFIYISKDLIPDEKTAHERMIADVDLYDQYLKGEVKGFIIYENDNTLDSCWGFYDLDSLMDHADLSDEDKETVRNNFTW